MTEPDPFWDAPCGTPVDFNEKDPDELISEVVQVLLAMSAALNVPERDVK